MSDIVLEERARKHMWSLVKERPLDINIETVTHCPMRCVFCPNSKLSREVSVMDMDLFERICADYYDIGGGAISFCSMHSDIFSDPLLFQRLKLIEKYKEKFYLYTTTNFLGIAKLDDVKLRYLLNTFSFLQVSIEGLDKDTYKRMCGLDAFEVVHTQLARVYQFLQTGNYRAKIGLYIRTPYAQTVSNSREFLELKNKFPIIEVRDRFFSWGGMIYQEDLPQGTFLEIADNSEKQADCVVPWVTLSVAANGLIPGCSCLDWEGRHIVGNINEQTITDVWRSKKSLGFKRSFSDRKKPDMCKECALYISADACFSSKSLINYSPLDGLYYYFGQDFS